jgi:hypothetical protein
MAIVDPPAQVQRAAWEAAVVLLTDFPDRLTVYQRVYCQVIRARGPDRQGWAECGHALRLFNKLVEGRT